MTEVEAKEVQSTENENSENAPSELTKNEEEIVRQIEYYFGNILALFN